MIKAVLFDLDGVLIDSEKIYVRFWMQAAEELGYSLPTQQALELRSCGKATGGEILSRVNGGRDVYDEIYARRVELMDEYIAQNGYEAKPGAFEALPELKRAGYRLAIVTASVLEKKLPMLERMGFTEYFDDIISAHEVKRSKPFPDVYLYAAEKLGIKPEECAAVEDSPNGIRSAHGAGMKVIMVPDLTGPDEELSRLCTVVDSLKDVPLTIRKLEEIFQTEYYFE